MTNCRHAHVLEDGAAFPEAVGVATVANHKHPERHEHPCCGDHERCEWVHPPVDGPVQYVAVNDLAGTSDIARMLGVGTNAVGNLRQRYGEGSKHPFPEPLAILNENGTAVFSRQAVIRWSARTGRLL